MIGLNVILLDCVVKLHDEGEKHIQIPNVKSLSYVVVMSRCLEKRELFNEEIRNIRKIVGLSVVEIAGLMNICMGTFKKWERGKCRMGYFAEKYLELLSVIR